MNFAFICNRNQARSQILSACFTKLLPEHNFESFGLIAHENESLPVVVNAVFEDWGLDSRFRKARNMNVHWDEIQKLDFIVAVTSFIAVEVRNLGFSGVILDLEAEAEIFGIEVRDPQLMSRNQCAFELAKYLKLSFTVFRKYGFIQESKKIRALIPENESLILPAINRAFTEVDSDSIILYGDLLAPKGGVFKHSPMLVSGYSYKASASAFEISGGSDYLELLVPAHAVMQPAQLYLSKAWFGLFEQINQREVILITPPSRSHSRFVPESFLAALQADELEIVT
jgi:protein-tyrosine-phosphatase